MKRPLRIAITTGDQDGIGTEVVAKALRSVGLKSGTQFFLWRSPHCPKTHLKQIDAKFRRVTVTNWPDALKAAAADSRSLIDISSPLPPAKWVEISAHAALFKNLDAIATGPLSKVSIVDAGFRDLGHTEILKRISGVAYVHMAFIGAQFSVVLATGHHPLRSVPTELNADRLTHAIQSAFKLRELLPKSTKKKPMAVLGLNPHSGEQGLIGSEEANIINPVLVKLKDNAQMALDGPLVPDAAFLPSEIKKYSIYVCCYHDQGLIPFKMAHGQAGVHVSLGLPFVRTSVDHGTAKNIFGRNKADPTSMIEAIRWAIALCREQNKEP